jgi:hypothetical protein
MPTVVAMTYEAPLGRTNRVSAAVTNGVADRSADGLESRSPKTRRYTEYEVGRDLENSGYLLRIDLLVN